MTRHKLRRTKIACTLGPATNSPEMIAGLIEAGMNVARLNFSHGSRGQHLDTIRQIREIAASLDEHVAILQDLQGPKIRTGTLKSTPINLRSGQRFTITTEQITGDSQRVSTSFESLPKVLKPGDSVLLSDGLVEIEVESISAEDVVCVVKNGGVVGERTGINLPWVDIGGDSLTDKDLEDLKFGLEQGVDIVALSFVRSARDVEMLRRRIDQSGYEQPIVVKLEKPQAIDELDQILELSDGIMVARGDLGVEAGPERVPVLQKRIISAANQARIPVITATQMLESMIHNPRPTRAEASDVANAVFDGSDAVMLSGETAIGQYPIQTVRMMDRIVREAETLSIGDYRRPPSATKLDYAGSLALAASQTAASLGAAAIVTRTQSGYSAQLASSHRPIAPIVAVTHEEVIARRLAMAWGVYPVVVPPAESLDVLLKRMELAASATGLIDKDGILVMLATSSPDASGHMNLMEIRRPGQAG